MNPQNEAVARKPPKDPKRWRKIALLFKPFILSATTVVAGPCCASSCIKGRRSKHFSDTCNKEKHIERAHKLH